ncbi:pepsin/retropepsin-like aspartic protease family protein [Uliginosibacterium aquaticum]|uniref:Aspartyl protease n=1 Tax=Uliginosibacterium aquaticum TaxID=2731212 RepID=A0ABX2IGD7_9RHOO|nr:hypothetical protein [Uliginosibacterium aquaticum]NSL53396.1 hypothetical protein [Uliginosibacterium aquaticum]
MKAYFWGWLVLMCVAKADALEPERVLHFELRQQLPILQVQVDGREASLILDLGGAAALALRPDWPEAGAAGEVREHSLALAPGELEVVPATVWRKTRIPPGIDGYLGWAYLQRYNLVFDYAKQAVRLYPRGAVHAECAGVPVPLRRLGSLPYVQFDHAGQALLLGLDTGANQNLIKPDVAGATLPDKILSIDGATLAGQALKLGPLRVLELPIPTLHGLLGYDFFARYRVCLDPAANTFALSAFEPEPGAAADGAR